MNHQEGFEGAYSGHHRTYRQQPPAHVPMLMEPCPNLIPPFFRVSETAENERGKQQDRIGDKIESPAVYHPVGKGQQRQERTHVPASHQQCLAVARSPLTPVKSLSDKPYIVYPSQHIRTGYRKLSGNVLFFRLLRQDCEVFFIILYANERQDTKTYSDFNVEDAAHLRGRIAGHRPGKRGVPLFRHGVGNEKRNAL
ncbi:hypothetical protein [Marseilla massiliensis]|uniref:hypothetical protein n=1 Tax=Marseilla massiliensis TaxID=1841864 RepID=UPI002012F7EA|nr:hypothetical protein [Marseilla massiliensis]MCL1610181.1 hypothetical protein [Marseilla massiliensis]